MGATLADNLPPIRVLAHPFGNPKKRDTHKEFFDPNTNFHKGLLPSIPVSYYHNWNPNTGKPTGSPIAIGIAKNPQYSDEGRWDDIEFFENIPLDVKERLQNAIEKETLRASPTVVPDFHAVDIDGHIKDWLTGSIAVFDAEGFRQPANRLAIGLPQMKALFDDAGISFPDLKSKEGPMNFTKVVAEKLKSVDAWLKAMPTIEKNEPENENDDDTWESLFGEPTEEEQEMPDADLQIKFENQMKAQNTRIAQLESELREKEFGAWFDEQARAGRVMPAERDSIMQIAFHLQQNGAVHPTMKADSGNAISLFDLFKVTVESRPSMAGFTDDQLKQMKGLFVAPAGKSAEMDLQKADAEAKRILRTLPEGAELLKETK